MRILFDIGHPAHIHLFKNFIFYLKEEGHKVIITSRKKDVTEVLLNHYNIDYISLSSPSFSKGGNLKELIARNKQIFNLHKKYNFNASFGTSASIGFLNKRFGVPAYNFNEDDDNIVKLYAIVAYPFATKIINPDCLKYKFWKRKRILHTSYHELAYLHPNNFIPDRNILKNYNIPKKYIIVRLSALKAHHDNNIRGIEIPLLEKIEALAKEMGYYIIKSIEGSKNHDIKPYDMHHIMAFSSLVLSDSQTMTAEAAVLGIPTIRINSFVGKISYLNEIENKYQLGIGFLPDTPDNIILNNLRTLLINGKSSNKQKIKLLLKDKVDFNQWMIDFFKSEILN